MLVGIYARDKLSVYVFHIRSSTCGGGESMFILSSYKCNICVKVAT